MICPRDQQVLEEHQVDHMSVFQCPQCHGIWLVKQDFTPMLHTATVSSTLTPVFPGKEHGAAECPVGNERHELEHKVVRGVPIDYCKRHQGFWLDGGELELLRQRVQLGRSPSPGKGRRFAEGTGDAGWWVAEGVLEILLGILTSL